MYYMLTVSEIVRNKVQRNKDKTQGSALLVLF